MKRTIDKNLLAKTPRRLLLSAALATMMLVSCGHSKDENSKPAKQEQVKVDKQEDAKVYNAKLNEEADKKLNAFLDGKRTDWDWDDMAHSSLPVFEKMLNDPRVDINQKIEGGYCGVNLSFAYDVGGFVCPEQKAKLLITHPKFDWKKHGVATMLSAIKTDFNPEFDLMINDPRLDVNAVLQDSGALWDDYTMLMCASRVGGRSYADALLKRSDIDVNKTNRRKQTALMKAVYYVHPAIVDMLLERPELDLYIVDCKNETALDKCKDDYIKKHLIARIEQDAAHGSEPAQKALEKIRQEEKTIVKQAQQKLITDSLQNQR